MATVPRTARSVLDRGRILCGAVGLRGGFAVLTTGLRWGERNVFAALDLATGRITYRVRDRELRHEVVTSDDTTSARPERDCAINPTRRQPATRSTLPDTALGVDQGERSRGRSTCMVVAS